MTVEEFENINWGRGNIARLTNGNDYVVKKVRNSRHCLVLYSDEYDTHFVADYRIIDCRISDYEEPEEIMLERKRKRQEAHFAYMEAQKQAAQARRAERARLHREEQERAHLEALARKAVKRDAKKMRQEMAKAQAAPKAPVAQPVAEEAPKKRVRQRISISTVAVRQEKVSFERKK